MHAYSGLAEPSTLYVLCKSQEQCKSDHYSVSFLCSQLSDHICMYVFMCSWYCITSSISIKVAGFVLNQINTLFCCKYIHVVARGARRALTPCTISWQAGLKYDQLVVIYMGCGDNRSR